MIAQVIVCARLPKHMGLFDYEVPDCFQDQIAVGQLVIVPFRRKQLFAIVSTLLDTPTTHHPLKAIDQLVHPEPVLHTDDVALLSTLSGYYGVSVGHLAILFLLPLQKRKVQQLTLHPFETIYRESSSSTIDVHLYDSPTSQSALVTQHHRPNTQTLVLVPEKHMVAALATQLSTQKTAVWHSDLSVKEQFATWLAIRNGEVDIVIGTRSAVCLSFAKLGQVIVDQAFHKEHKQIEQAPRFDVRDMVNLRFVTQGIPVSYISHTLSVETYYHLHTGTYTYQGNNHQQFSPGQIIVPSAKRQQLIDMNNERVGKNFSFLSYTAEQALLRSNESTFIYINRTYDAKQYQTLDTPYLAATTVSVKTFLQDHPLITNPVLGQEDLQDNTMQGPVIIVGSQGTISQIDWSLITQVICISLDPELSYPEANTIADVWYRHHTMLYKSRPDCQWYIQTKHPEHVFFRSLIEPDRWYRTELQARKSLPYPPYAYALRCLIADKSEATAQKKAQTAYTRLYTDLTIRRACHTISRPYPLDPAIHRGQYVMAIRLIVHLQEWPSVVSYINNVLSDDWHLDPRPTTTFSY